MDIAEGSELWGLQLSAEAEKESLGAETGSGEAWAKKQLFGKKHRQSGASGRLRD